MILDQTNKRIDIVLGEAHATTPCDWTASYGGYAAAAFTPGASDGVTNGTTAVVAVAAPPSGTQRLVQEITLHNADTIDHTVTLQLIDGAATRIFRSRLVPAGTDFAYSPSLAVSPSDASYFSIVAGSPDQLVLQAPTPDNFAVRTSDTIGTPSGVMHVYSGDSDNPTGEAYIYSGNNSGTGDSGDAGSGTGNVNNGTSGYTYLWSGDALAGSSGNVSIASGNAPTSGAVSVNSGPGDATGNIDIASGDASAGASGHTSIGSGAAAGGGNQSGDITLTVGAVSGGATAGHILLPSLPTAAPAVSHALWEDTSTTPHTIRITP